jgi:hypothetical protein
MDTAEDDKGRHKRQTIRRIRSAAASNSVWGFFPGVGAATLSRQLPTSLLPSRAIARV